jgi:hypothetical protein
LVCTVNSEDNAQASDSRATALTGTRERLRVSAEGIVGDLVEASDGYDERS